MRVRSGIWLGAVCITIGMVLPHRPDSAAAVSPAPAPVPLDVLNYELHANQDTPELCFRLSRTVLRQPDKPLESFVSTDPAARLSARPRNNFLCLSGFGFGVTYTVTLKAGLPGLTGTLGRDAQFRVQIPNRPPELGFVSPSADILPRLGTDGLPIRSVNLRAIDLEIYRISDRDMLDRTRLALTGDTVAGFAPTRGERVWRGTIEPKGGDNQDVVSFLPIDKTLGTLRPGLYVAVAWPRGVPAEPGGESLPTQYFMVSDLGLSAFRGASSLTVGVRSLATAAAVQGVDIALIAKDNRELGRVRTDENGLAMFDGALLQKMDGDRPWAIDAYGTAGEFAALPLEPAPSGFLAPSRAVATIETDRATYHGGDMVNLIAWTRSALGAAVTKLPLTINIRRPNGALYDTQILEDRGAGSYSAEFRLPTDRAGGRWQVEAVPPAETGAAGDAAFDVEAWEGEHLAVSLGVDAAVLDPGQPGDVSVQAQYADGQAAANSPGEARISIEAAANPFPAFPGFSFGLADEIDPVVASEPARFSTDPAGKAGVPIRFAGLPSATKPLDARIGVNVLNTAGRPQDQAIEVPVATQNLFLGIKPGSAGGFPEGQATHFEVVALSRDGARQEKPDAGWEILRRDFTPSWEWDGQRFTYRASIKDAHVAGGNVAVPADAPGVIDVPLPAGRYRIEVFDPKGEAVSSVYFSVGWAPSQAGVAADRVILTPARAAYMPGEGEDIFVKPPYESDVTLVTADADIRGTLVQHVTAAGANVHIDTPRDARAGLTIVASAVAPPVPAAPGLPRRAIGTLELPVDPTARALDVKLDLPQKVFPGQVLSIPISATGAGDDPAFVEIVATDGEPGKSGDTADDDQTTPRAIIGAPAPLPATFDLYGRIITPSGLSAGYAATAAAPPAGDMAVARVDAGTVSVSSGIIALDKSGKANVTLPVPDVTGTLSVRAIAWSSTRLGRTGGELHVHQPLAAELRAPKSLAPDDRAELTLSLRNMDGPRGEYHIKLRAEGSVALQDDSAIVVNLAEHEQRFQPVTLLGHGPGPGGLAIAVTGPNGIDFERHMAIQVREGARPVTRHATITLKQGGVLATDTALTGGLRPDTMAVSLAASVNGAFDTAGLARELRDANYQSAEHIVDEATADLPPSPRQGGGAPPTAAGNSTGLAHARLAVEQLFDLQSADGGFSVWGGGASDPWLSAYVTEFITRARNAGVDVPQAPFDRALDYLASTSALEPAPLNTPAPSAAALEGAAYAGKVLAMNNRIEPSRLRYFADRTNAQVHSPITDALLAAGFASLRDDTEAAALFARARTQRGEAAADGFGSDLRDQAMLTTLMAESGAVAQPLVEEAFAREFADAGAHRQFSPQEAAWVLRSQSLVKRDTGNAGLKLGDKTVQGNVIDVPVQADGTLAPIRNLAESPVHLAITVSGIPTANESKDASGYEVQRAFFDTMGKPLEPMGLKQNDVVVVVISGRYSGQGEGHPVIHESLPAGWDMEAASIVDPGARYPWLKDLSGTAATALDGETFTAAPVLSGEHHEFKIAYVIRAATRGQFAMPGTLVEDLVQPGLSARTAGGRTKIDSPAL
jgi:uncharacterized protein YfaS (alpha-2-macroglobulin family)